MKPAHLFSLITLGLLSAISFPAGAAERSVRSERDSHSERKWELMVESTASVRLTKVKDRDTSTTYGAAIGGGYFVTPQLEIVASLGYFHYSFTDVSAHSFIAIVGPLFNFSPDVENSFYVTTGIGQVTSSSTLKLSSTVSSTHSTSQFYWMAGVGKRFRLAEHVSWTPQLSYSYLDGADDVGTTRIRAQSDWAIIPFRLSILL